MIQVIKRVNIKSDKIVWQTVKIIQHKSTVCQTL